MARRKAYEILKECLLKGSYANLLLRKGLDDLKDTDRYFVTELVNGVIRNFDLLCFQYEGLYQKAPKKEIQILLAMLAYEKFFLGHEDYVLGSVYPMLAKKGQGDFIMAMLKKLGQTLRYSSKEEINFSMPKWLYDLFRAQYPDSYKDLLANVLKRPMVFYRLNHLKCQKSDLKDVTFLNEDTFIAHKSLINTKEFKKGYFYVQDYNSALIYKYLDLKDGDHLLDMCSAPGTKLFNCLDQKLKLKVVANDLHKTRIDLGKKGACHLGVEGLEHLCLDATKIGDLYLSSFDKILLDAPCSGEGMIRKDPSILKNYSLNNINKLSKLQSELLDKALDLLKDGGYLVYSTCTYAIEENEMNVLEFLKRHEGVTLLDTTIDHCHRGLKYKYLESAKLLRFSPLDHTEGQFVALMKVKKDGDKKISYMKETRHKLVENFVYENLGLNKYYLYLYHDYYYLSLSPLPSISKGLLRPGIEVGTIKKGIFYPSHSLYRANSLRPYFKKVIDLSLDEYLKYRQGLSLFKDVSDGFYLLTYQDLSLGFSKASKGELKNKYPKGLRF